MRNLSFQLPDNCYVPEILCLLYIFPFNLTFNFSNHTLGFLLIEISCPSLTIQPCLLCLIQIVQAMNFFAGLLLLLMPEENAFWWVQKLLKILRLRIDKLLGKLQENGFVKAPTFVLSMAFCSCCKIFMEKCVPFCHLPLLLLQSSLFMIT